IKGCDGFVQACKADEALKDAPKPPPKSNDTKFGDWLASMMATFGQIALWLLVVGIVVAIAIPVVQAIMKGRRDKAVADPPPPLTPTPEATIVQEELEQISDAELLLRRGEDLLRRGDLDRATLTFLHAALRALDQRGAIRLARHRTHGEYVRGCKD